MDSFSLIFLFDSRIIETMLLRIRLNLARLRFLICCVIIVVIQGGSDGLIRTNLLGIHDFERLRMVSVMFFAYWLMSVFCMDAQSNEPAFARSKL